MCPSFAFFPCRHKKEKKKDKDRERERERRSDRDYSRDDREEHSNSKKKKSKDKDRDRKSDGDKGDVKVGVVFDSGKPSVASPATLDCAVANAATWCDCACHEPVSLWQITRDYDEEEQGYGSEKEREARKDSDDSALSPQSVEGNGTSRPAKAKVNGADDRHEDDMDVSD